MHNVLFKMDRPGRGLDVKLASSSLASKPSIHSEKNLRKQSNGSIIIRVPSDKSASDSTIMSLVVRNDLDLDKLSSFIYKIPHITVIVGTLNLLT